MMNKAETLPDFLRRRVAECTIYTLDIHSEVTQLVVTPPGAEAVGDVFTAHTHLTDQWAIVPILCYHTSDNVYREAMLPRDPKHVEAATLSDKMEEAAQILQIDAGLAAVKKTLNASDALLLSAMYLHIDEQQADTLLKKQQDTRADIYFQYLTVERVYPKPAHTIGEVCQCLN